MLRYCVLAELPLSEKEQPTVTCQIVGGLGNQLFILFATLAYAMEHRLAFRLPRYRGMLGLDHSPRPAYWDTLLRGLRGHLAEDDELEGVHPQGIHEKEEFAYHPLPPPSGNDRWICLYGYFQHPRYAEPHFQSILDLLRLPLDRYATDAKGCIAMHFRLGDYKNLSPAHVLPAQYYADALRRVVGGRRRRTVKYAMQDKESDKEEVERVLDSLRRQFPRLTFERLDPTMQDWEQLLFMARCDHNIVANSTFSWWAARLNRHGADAVVVCPRQWMHGTGVDPIAALAPAHWAVI